MLWEQRYHQYEQEEKKKPLIHGMPTRQFLQWQEKQKLNERIFRGF